MGAGVTTATVGDRVVLSFASCPCAPCRTGRPTQCPTYFPLNFGAHRSDGTTSLRDRSGQPIGGSFFGQSSMAQYAVASQHSVVPIAVEDDDELTMLAPIGCGSKPVRAQCSISFARSRDRVSPCSGRAVSVTDRNLLADLPEVFGPWQTAWKRHRRYAGDGTWDRVLIALLALADATGNLDW